jgi:predicted HicB family RNase H-like nuclease
MRVDIGSQRSGMGRPKSPQTEVSKKLNVEIPLSYHKRLKIEAASRNLSMTDFLMVLIEKNCAALVSQERIIR